MTPAERKALLFLALLIAFGAGVRVVRARAADGPDSHSRTALAAQLARLDSARAAGGSRRPRSAAAPRRASSAPELGYGPVDLDRAAAPEIQRLPGVGPVLAQRIVADRETLGPFGSLTGLQRVRGVGPRLAERLRPHVTFSGVARPVNTVIAPGRAPPERRGASRASRVP